MSILPEHIVLEDVIDIVKSAGMRSLDFFDASDLEHSVKEDKSPVTEADYAANDILVAGLQKYGIPILSEEMKPPSFDEHEFLWIIDPIDGTRSFIEGRDEFAVMVGLVQKGKPVLGIVYLPKEDVLYHAQKGQGAFVERNGKTEKISVSDVSEFSHAHLVVSRRAAYIDSFKEITDRAGIESVSFVSSNGVKICRIAEGTYDTFFNPSSKLGQWDYCAPDIIVQEAGGTITYCNGEEVVYGEDWDKIAHGVVVSNTKLHEKMLDQMSIQFDCKRK